MIIVRIAGGLANRMFQYSYYRHLKSQGKNVYLDDNYRATKWKFEDVDIRKIFPAIEYEAPSRLQILLHCGGYGTLQKILRHSFLIKNHLVIYDKANSNFEELYDIADGKYVIGTLCCEDYFKDISDRIRKDLTFTPFTDEKNISMAQKMSEESSVAIHIRKGKDYLEKPSTQGTCPVEYYRKAIEYIKEHVENPVFYVFSDNFEWVDENISDLDYTRCDWNPVKGWGNHFDMQLQTYCKHNIIANSTYSWWGAWLGNNKDKIVILPEQWFSDRKATDMRYVPNGWIAM